MKRKLIGLLILMLGLLPAGAQNKNDAKKRRFLMIVIVTFQSHEKH